MCIPSRFIEWPSEFPAEGGSSPWLDCTFIYIYITSDISVVFLFLEKVLMVAYNSLTELSLNSRLHKQF